MQDLQALSDAIDPKHGVVLPILQYPHPLLSQRSEVVVSDIPTDESLQALLRNMVATMQHVGGAGLAAVQVGHPIRALVVQDEYGQVTKVINPRIVEVSEETERIQEGCLSFLGLFLNVRRPKEVVVEFYDETGTKRTTVNEGLLGRAIQHEIKHLDGKTFLDELNSVERQQALNKYKAAKRRVAAVLRARSAKPKQRN